MMTNLTIITRVFCKRINITRRIRKTGIPKQLKSSHNRTTSKNKICWIILTKMRKILNQNKQKLKIIKNTLKDRRVNVWLQSTQKHIISNNNNNNSSKVKTIMQKKRKIKLSWKWKENRKKKQQIMKKAK